MKNINVALLNAGKRLKTARLLAGYTRKDMENKFSISASTIQAWETGKNPLREKAAKKVTDAFMQANLICTSEWLLYGIGTSPRTLEEIDNIKKNSVQEEVTWGDEISIQKEINAFTSFNNDSIVLMVDDDGNLPSYSTGDYVGGKKRYGNGIIPLDGKICIVRLENELTLVRLIRTCYGNQLFNLFCTNPQTQLREPVIKDVKINFAAPIIWHRKKDYYKYVFEK